jgi:dihydroxyacetone kinase-like predicted kinase
VERERRLLHAVPAPSAACAVVAVVAGAGNRRLFENLGARVVDGGRTMNPSTAELVAAMEASGAAEVILLPNDANVLLAAEHAAAAMAIPVSVIPTVSVQAGLAAALAFEPSLDRAGNEAEMAEAAAGVATGAVTVASRDVNTNGVAVRKGAWLGLAEGRPLAGGSEFDAVARAVVDRLLAEPRAVLTLLTGEEPPPLEGLLGGIAAAHPGVEVEVHEGGQPHYALLVSAE